MKDGTKRPGVKKAAGIGTTIFLLAAAFIGPLEGKRNVAYRDIVGVPTICYGETHGVHLGDVATDDECDAMLMQSLATFDAALIGALKVEHLLPPKTRVALLSWTYNVGIGAMQGSTLVREANAGHWQSMCDQLLRWNKARGRTVRGLTNRRGVERGLCLEGLREAGMIQ